MRDCRVAETKPPRFQSRKSPQFVGLWAGARDFGDEEECVVELRGHELCARHAVMSNWSLVSQYVGLPLKADISGQFGAAR